MSFSLYSQTKMKNVSCERLETRNLLEYANHCRHLGLFNNVTITSGNESISANKLILSCFSSFFEKMFQTEMKEKYDNKVKMDNIKGSLVNIIVDYIYTGTIQINNDNVFQLLSASDYLQIDDLKEFCVTFLKTNITPESCFTILDFADRYKTDLLKTDVYQFIGENINEVVCSQEFKTISKTLLITCLSIELLHNTQVEAAYKGIKNWIEHDKERRSQDFPELLQLLNLDKLPSALFEDAVISNQNLVMGNYSCRDLILSVLVGRLKTYENKSHEENIFSIGGFAFGSGTEKIHKLFGKSTNTYPALPVARWGGCNVKMDGTIYYIGGNQTGNTATRTVWKMLLNEIELEWEKVAPMTESRYTMGASIFDNAIVVVGGVNDSGNPVSSGESYSPKLSKWNSIIPMNQCRSGNGLTVCNGYLYSVGGFDGNNVLSSVERTRCLGGKWENIKPMHTPRRFLAVVNLNSIIYAIGGNSSLQTSTKLNSIEKYDDVKNEWIYVSNMNFKRSSCSACVLQGKIFVVGGVDAANGTVKQIEFYDPLIDKWFVSGTTEVGLWHHSLAVI